MNRTKKFSFQISKRQHKSICSVLGTAFPILVTLVFGIMQGASAAPFDVTTFTGGDVGEGLDLDGTFTHAVNVGGPEFTIWDVTFAADTTNPPNVADIAMAGTPSLSNGFNFDTKPEYGSSTADNDLETIMHSIRFVNAASTGEGMTIDLENLNIGQDYSLQLLFSENRNANDRRFEVVVEGTVLEAEFGVIQTHGTWTTAPNVGAVIRHEFQATDDTLNISFNAIPGHTFPDDNPLLQALTLETVPEPNSALLLGMVCSGIALVRRRRRLC